MILFVNDLTVIDFSYFCAKRGIVGESWIVDLTLHGELNHESMVLDFGLVKKQIKHIIDQTVDHKLAVATQANLTISQQGEQTQVEGYFGEQHHHFAMSAPHQAVCEINAEQVNEQSVTDFLIAQITPKLPDNVTKVTLVLRPQRMESFYYHYSHGLKKHDGNCQRIVHGHRSTLKIELNNMSMPRLQKQWADKWADIYLASAEDQISASELKHIEAQPEDVCFAYTAAQGYFELALAKSRVDILPCDTTVECIADYLSQQIKLQYSDKDVKITAYEGVEKGAISYA